VGDVVVEERKFYGEENEPLSISGLITHVPNLYLSSKTQNRATTMTAFADRKWDCESE
jgi:hypothetical protein